MQKRPSKRKGVKHSLCPHWIVRSKGFNCIREFLVKLLGELSNRKAKHQTKLLGRLQHLPQRVLQKSPKHRPGRSFCTLCVGYQRIMYLLSLSLHHFLLICTFPGFLMDRLSTLFLTTSRAEKFRMKFLL